MKTHISKTDLTKLLSEKTQEFLKDREVVLYAAKPESTKKKAKPYQASPNLRDEAYREYLKGLELASS